MMDRRTLIGRSAALAALAAAGTAVRAASPHKVGIQLYTVRNIFQPEPVRTLEQIAAIGYREVEYGGGGYDKMDHGLLRRTMDRVGLTAPMIHVNYDEMLGDFKGCVARARTLGAHTLVVPYMTKEHLTAQAWGTAVGNFNRFARDLKNEGLGFAYHNHDFEFTVKPDGVSLFDRLLRDRDPLVLIELDLFWVAKAGEDVPGLIKRLEGTVAAYHVKDMGADGMMAAVGTGSMDFSGIFRLNKIAGVRHFFVENDIAPAPYLPDITTSYKNLTKLLAHA